MDEATLQIVLKARDELSAVFDNAKKKVGDFSDNAKKGADIVNGAMLGAGLAVAGVATASFKMASDFQASMKLIQTNAGASAQEVQNMTKAVLAMAGSVGTTPDELAQGLYHIESAGFRGSDALNILRSAAEGAKVGNANLEDTTQALISLTASHIKGITGEVQAMGTLNAIVGSGDMRMQDLAQAMSTGVAPAAAAFGLSIQDVGAAMATLTDNAVPPVDAATRLRMTISMMGAPSQAAAKALAHIGLASTKLADDMRSKGMLAALQDLQTHLKKSGETAAQQQETIARAFGGGQESATLLTLLGQMDRLQSKYGDISEGAKKFGSAWDETQQNANMAFSKLWAQVQTLGIELGMKMIPTVTKLVNFVATNLVPALDSSSSWIDKNKTALEVLGGVITAVVLPPLIAYQVKMGIDNVKAVRAFLVEGDKLILNFIKQGAQAVIAGAKMVASAVETAAVSVASATQSAIAWVGAAVDSAAAWVVTQVKMVAQFVIAAASAVANAAISAAAWVVAAHNSEYGFIGSILRIIGLFIQTAASAVINAAVTSAAWVASSVKSVISWVTSLPSVIAGFAATSASAAIHAGISSASWVASATVTAAQWVATSVRAIASFVAMAASAVAQSAISVVAFTAGTAALTAWVVITEAVKAATVIWTGAQWLLNAALTANPVGLLIIGVAALVAGIIYAYNHVSVFRDAINGLGNTIKNIFNGIVTDIKNTVNSIIGGINSLINGVNSVAGKVPGVGSSIKIPNIPHFDNGGWVNQTGLALVHQGEFVLSNDMLAGKSSVPSNIVNNTNNSKQASINIGQVVVKNEMDIDTLVKKLSFQLKFNGGI